MTYFSIGEDYIEFLVGFAVVFCILGLAAWVALFFVKAKDQSKPLQTAKVKIIEKIANQRSVEWYVVEFENGERKKLRNFNVNKVFVAVGDVGIIKYNGITIQSFQSIRAFDK